MTGHFPNPDALVDAAGFDLGVSDWIELDQARIDLFADATGDHQWIHVDPKRAAAGPFGGVVAHGYLLLALVTPLTFELLKVDDTAAVINAGSDRVRYLTPVHAGKRVRAKVSIQRAEQTPVGVRVTFAVTIEAEGADKPALVAQILVVYVPTPVQAG